MKQLRSLSKDFVLPQNPALVEMALHKLSDGELERAPSIEPVLYARLERKSYDAGKRDKVITELAKLHNIDRVTEMISSLAKLDAKGGTASGGAQELAKMLGLSAAADLAKARTSLVNLASTAKLGPVRGAAWAALIIGDGKPETAWAAASDETKRKALMDSIGLIPDPSLRAKFQPLLTDALGDPKFRSAAMKALPLMGAENAKANFKVLIAGIQSPQTRTAAVRAVMQLPRDSWDKALAGAAAEGILTWAKTVPQRRPHEAGLCGDGADRHGTREPAAAGCGDEAPQGTARTGRERLRREDRPRADALRHHAHRGRGRETV